MTTTIEQTARLAAAGVTVHFGGVTALLVLMTWGRATHGLLVRGCSRHISRCRLGGATRETKPKNLADDGITVVTNQHAGTSNYRTLDELHERLDPTVFWRVHRSHLVNINKIKEIVPWFSRNYILRMKDAKATEIPVSRTQTRRLREYLKL